MGLDANTRSLLERAEAVLDLYGRDKTTADLLRDIHAALTAPERVPNRRGKARGPSKAALVALSDIAVEPLRRSRLDPDLANLLLREGLVQMLRQPDPESDRKVMVDYLSITTAGRQAVSRIGK